MIEFSVTVDGQKEVVHMLDAIVADISDMSTAMQQVGEYMEMSVKQNFKAGGRPEKWTPLAKATKTKKRGGESARPLQDTGNLMNSIASEYGKDFVIVAPGMDYGKCHITGTKHMPARDFNVLQDSDVPRIMKIIIDDLGGSIK